MDSGIDLKPGEGEELGLGLAIAGVVANAIDWGQAPPWASGYKVLRNEGLWLESVMQPASGMMLVAPKFGDVDTSNLAAEFRIFRRPNPRDSRETQRPVFGRGQPGHVVDVDTAEGRMELDEANRQRVAYCSGHARLEQQPQPYWRNNALGAPTLPLRGDIAYAEALGGVDADDAAPRPGENPHSGDISGYRKMEDHEVALINDIKAAERAAAAMWARVADRKGIDGRWASLAKTQLEQGFMALVRAVAKPRSPFEAE